MSFTLTDENFIRAKHVQYFMFHARNLPEDYTDLDVNRITVLYFAVAALDLLESLHVLDRDDCIDFIYKLQLKSSPSLAELGCFGFIGGNYLSHNSMVHPTIEYVQGHVAMIYTALTILITLDDDLSRVDRKNIAIGRRDIFGILVAIHGQRYLVP